MMTPGEFVQRFEPDQEALETMYRLYRRQGLDEAARYVATLAIAGVRQRAEARRGVPAAQSWAYAHQIYAESGDPQAALDCARRAVAAAPHHYESRELLARELLRQEQWEAAREELQWCLRRRPEEESIQRALMVARKKSRESQYQRLATPSSPPADQHQASLPPGRSRTE